MGQQQQTIQVHGETVSTEVAETLIGVGASLGGQHANASSARPALVNLSIRGGEQISRPSPTLDPGNIEHIDGYEDHSAYVHDAHAAYVAMHACVTSIINAREASKKDPTLTEAAQVIAVAAFAERVHPKVLRQLDNALVELQKRIDHVEAELRRPLEASSLTPLASEIRTYARSLGSDKRNALIVDLINRGDERSLGALLAGPAFLAGLDDVTVEMYTRRFNEAKSPELVKRLAVMKLAHKRLSDAGSVFVAQGEKAQGATYEVIDRLRAAKSKSDRAFVLPS